MNAGWLDDVEARTSDLVEEELLVGAAATVVNHDVSALLAALRAVLDVLADWEGLESECWAVPTAPRIVQAMHLSEHRREVQAALDGPAPAGGIP